MANNPAKGMREKYNAVKRFIDQNVQNGLEDKTAIYYEDREITYGELQNKVNQFAAALENIDIEYEDRVLLLMPDKPEFVYSFFGSIKIGAVPVPLNVLLSNSDYEYLFDDSRAKVLVVQESIWDKIKAERDQFLYLKFIIVVPDGERVKSNDVLHYHEFIDNDFEVPQTFESTEEDEAFWLYSSGSTGKPKGAKHFQKSMEFVYENYGKKVLNISEEDRLFSASKLFFAYGLGNGMYMPLGAGAEVVLMSDKPSPENVFAAIEKYRPTIFFGVPTLYGSLLYHAENSDREYDLSSVRVCVSAGEKLPQAYVVSWKEKFNLDILDGIGSTEALHVYLSNTTDGVVPGSTGKVVPGYAAKIVNEDMEEVETNEVGDLFIKGDSIASSFWRRPDENKKRYLGEWFFTGDKYYKDENENFWYFGRSDDMMNVGGIVVSPIEIENELLLHDDVLEAAVVGEKDEVGLLKPSAYIVLKNKEESGSEKEKELVKFLKSRLAKYKYPRNIIFTDSLPKTATGKIQRFKLRDGYQKN